MLNSLYLTHLEDLLDEARINPHFPLAEELASLAAVMAADEVGV